VVGIQRPQRTFQSLAPASLPAFDRHRQTVLVPEPFHLLVVHAGPGLTQGLTGFATAFPRMLSAMTTRSPSYVPLDHRWDVAGQFAVEEVRQAVCLALAHMTAGEAEQLLRLCSSFQPSAAAIQPIVDKVSAEIELHREALDTTIRAGVEPPAETKVLVASLDGTNVLLREPGVRRPRPCERPRGERDEPKNATYKNAMVGTISFYGAAPAGAEGPERLRSLSTARMPQDGAVTCKRDFERQLEILEKQLGRQVRRVLLCDGHRVLWSYVDHQERFDDYEKLVDFYHTDEHLSHAAEALFGKQSVEAERWYAKYRRVLLEQDDGVSSVRRSLAYYGRSSISGVLSSRDYGTSSGRSTNSFAVPRERYVKWKLHRLKFQM
jgi:hypothetical protein